VKLEFQENYRVDYPGSLAEAIAFVQNVPLSLQYVSFIRNLRVTNNLVEAVLVIPAPMVGEQQVDFASTLLATSDGARLSALERSGHAWAEVWGEAQVSVIGAVTSIRYHLRVVAHLKLPLPEHWGGRTFAKMAESAAAQMLPRIAEDFPRGLRAAMPTPAAIPAAIPDNGANHG
jgi:hypothetical protein